MPKKKNGRPTIYTQKAASKICERLALGESLRGICREDKMPDMSTVVRWLCNDHPPDDPRYEFRAQYLRARIAQAELMVDEILDLADDTSHDVLYDTDGYPVKASNVRIQRHKLQCDVRMFFLTKVLPRFGERLSHQGGSTNLQVQNQQPARCEP